MSELGNHSKDEAENAAKEVSSELDRQVELNSDYEVPPPERPKLPSWAIDTKARREARNFADEPALKEQRTENEKRWLWVLGWILPCFLVVFSLAFIIAFVSWVCHHLLPESQHWLEPKQVSNIQSLIFSGSLGAIVSGTLRKKLTNQ
ncbi:MAG: hypothetical protein MI750_11690 [Xanthomonadales bacterium]|nr:hypothetical protein [Xanthomonadales bacterium]